jgi:bacterioferritin-associated ferredoxin
MIMIRIYTLCMIICVCHRISEHAIADCGRQGMCFEAVQFELGVATQCGLCECEARKILVNTAPQQVRVYPTMSDAIGLSAY